MPVIESAGQTGHLNIRINRECTWAARSEVDWIAISPASGQGDAQIDYSVAANPLAAPRTGVIVVNEQRAELRQAAACLYTLTPRQQTAQSSGERLTVTVSTAAGCAWTAVSQSSWISVESGANGSGNGTVSLLVTPNTGASRTGTVSIAGQPHTVSQSAAEGTPPTPPMCRFVLSSTAVTVAPAGGSASVSVTVSDGCEWTASSADGWLTIVNGASGNGAGSVQFTAAPNPSRAARTGALTIAGQTVTVDQAAGPVMTTVTGEVSDLQGDCPTLNFVVGGRRVRTDAATEFDKGCGGLKNGREVSVEGSVQIDGTILATHVRR
jgi:hypothetical protein